MKKHRMLLQGIPLACLTICIACNSTPSNSKQEAVSVQNTFHLPDIPEDLKNVTDRMDYLAIHYWDHVQGIDSTNYASNSQLEQYLVDYFDLLEQVSPTKAQTSLTSLLHKTEIDSREYSYFKQNLQKYLHDPNSPMRNDELYIPVVKYIIADQTSGIADKTRAEFELKMMAKNRKGTMAADFQFQLPNGTTQQLTEYTAPYTLLYFYNPDCHACQETAQRIKSSNEITKLLKRKKLQLLAIYPDEEQVVWRKHQSELPTSWVNGIDTWQKLRKEEIYDLRAMPTLYLLDAHKIILLKDATPDEIETYLMAKQK